eukprot:TRINITY_DN23195_c0_g1_i1.p1 TRINITY_DN23195_c0_g1~~TRINITY_DN23195_c0_g1_i1.p1  ORF type:complete len:266 (-),score=25.66 TRINITY_DN23195_c0_g1_i1:419-1216(-)
MGQGCSSSDTVAPSGRVDLAREYQDSRSPRRAREYGQHARPRASSAPLAPAGSYPSNLAPSPRVTARRMSLEPTAAHKPTAATPSAIQSGRGPASVSADAAHGAIPGMSRRNSSAGWAERSPRTPGRANALVPLDRRPSLPTETHLEPKPVLSLPESSPGPSPNHSRRGSRSRKSGSPEARRVSVTQAKLAAFQERLDRAPPHVRATYNHSARLIQNAYRQFRMRRVLAVTMIERQRQKAIREQASENHGLSVIAAGRRKSFSQF